MSPQHVGIVDAIKLFFNNYTNFSARSTRSEYWWWVLANAAINIVLQLVVGNISFTAYMVAMVIFYLGTIIPNISLCIRRLHDIGKPGTWLLIALIPLVGAIILLILTAKESGPANQWGEPAKN